MGTISKKELKIYEIKVNGEKDWIAAFSLFGALKQYLKWFDDNIHEFTDEDSIEELPREKWADHKVINTDYDETDPDDWQSETFEQYISRLKFPEYIAGTRNL